MPRRYLALLVIPCLAFGVGARTEELPRRGDFNVTIEQHGSWEGFPVAQRYWVWIARRDGVFAGTGLLHGMRSRCISKGKTAYGISTAEIHCEHTDRDGDKIFERSSEQCACAAGGKGGTGSGEFLGGTGKYIGIRGRVEIERRVGTRDPAARTWTDDVTVVGRWALP